MQQDYASFLPFAHELADIAGDVIRPYFRQPITVDVKGDFSPVTVADREAEAAIRELILKHYPDHGIYGEEGGTHQADAEYVWFIDPIDGTKSFMTGKPSFGTLIALIHRGMPVLGIIDQPILHERWAAVSGSSTFFNQSRVSTRGCDTLSSATLYTTSPLLFNALESASFKRVTQAVRYALYGGDCYSYALLASGFVDLVIEAGLKPYDYLALVPVIEQAGGIITDWEGRPLHMASDGHVIAAGDPALHMAALELLQP